VLLEEGGDDSGILVSDVEGWSRKQTHLISLL